jgi:hypothetical protein
MNASGSGANKVAFEFALIPRASKARVARTTVTSAWKICDTNLDPLSVDAIAGEDFESDCITINLTEQQVDTGLSLVDRNDLPSETVIKREADKIGNTGRT